jgi:UDP-N-acetylmuramoylalanine--D-glutamate ligase
MHKTNKKTENQLVSARKNALKNINKTPFNRQWTAEIEGVNFINDSASVDLEWALETIEQSNKPIIWIMGETIDTIDYQNFKSFLNDKVEAIISYGQFTKEHNYKMEAIVPFYSTHNGLENALNRAWDVANPKFTIVFSPACKDEKWWDDYEERGDFFNSLINKLQ